ncbi:MAG: hypothetical protein ACOYBR_09985 [Fluviibacter sp.]
MLRSALIATTFLIVSISCLAQEEGFTSADYLTITTVQQEIYVRRMLNGNDQVYGVCTEGKSVQEITQIFTNWVVHNPQYLGRTLFSSFTAALMDICHAKNVKIK